MSLIQYMAEVKDGLLLELPSEAEELHLKPGEKVEIRLVRQPDVPACSSSTAHRSVSGKPKKLAGMGAFKGKLGGTEALFQEKQSEIALEERRF